jgi:hypothetical protein
MDRKFKQWWSTIPPTSTKWTTIFYLKPLNRILPQTIEPYLTSNHWTISYLKPLNHILPQTIEHQQLPGHTCVLHWKFRFWFGICTQMCYPHTLWDIRKIITWFDVIKQTLLSLSLWPCYRRDGVSNYFVNTSTKLVLSSSHHPYSWEASLDNFHCVDMPSLMIRKMEYWRRMKKYENLNVFD